MKRKFRITIEVDGGMTVFDSTNSAKQVEEWVDAFTKSAQAKTILVYELDPKIGAYGLTQKLTRAEEPVERVIGFGRW